MTVLMIFLAAAAGILAGTWHEYHTGTFDHLMRKIAKPPPPTTAPRSHDDFIDDCEQFNKAMITIALDMRVLEAPETWQ